MFEQKDLLAFVVNNRECSVVVSVEYLHDLTECDRRRQEVDVRRHEVLRKHLMNAAIKKWKVLIKKFLNEPINSIPAQPR